MDRLCTAGAAGRGWARLGSKGHGATRQAGRGQAWRGLAGRVAGQFSMPMRRGFIPRDVTYSQAAQRNPGRA